MAWFHLPLVVAAVIHLLPVVGVLGAERLQALYGVPIDDPTLLLAMQHRAALFGVFGLALLVGAVDGQVRTTAVAMTLAADLAFLGLAMTQWPPSRAMMRVVVADVVSVGCLVVVLWGGRG